MFVKNSNANGFSVKAWIGDAKTLLAFNFKDPKAAKDLAGFSICVQPHGQPSFFLLNKLVLPPNEKHAVVAGEPANSSANAPIQKFRWLHVPGLFHQSEKPFFGIYTYTITPRYFKNGILLPLDAATTVAIDVMVQPFATPQVELGFTRGFVQSQAFVTHFGINAPFRPAGKELIFDTGGMAGTNAAGESYTFLQEYTWSGFTARTKILGILNDVTADPDLSLDVFAYDLNEPDVMKAFFELASQGRIRIILDNASLHHKPGAPEDAFETEFRKQMKGKADILRGKFGRFAHDKVFIVYKKGVPLKVLTGSTNFSVTGMYVNSNHVLVFNNPNVAELYSKVFDEAFNDKTKNFQHSPLSGQQFIFNQKGLPKMAIAFSPHDEAFATGQLNAMATRISATHNSVFFAVMDVESGGGTVLEALKKLHTHQEIFSYGITDNAGTDISLYRPGVRDGILVTGKPGTTTLPPPFEKEVSVGLGHQVHHKFVVCDFNTPNAIVWCGSSNLALGGEQANGDNLIHIKDTDIATVFAIEAMALIDHFDFRDAHGKTSPASVVAPKAIKGKGKTAQQHEEAKTAGPQKATPLQLYDNDSWALRYFDEKDLHFTDRELFGS